MYFYFCCYYYSDEMLFKWTINIPPLWFDPFHSLFFITKLNKKKKNWSGWGIPRETAYKGLYLCVWWCSHSSRNDPGITSFTLYHNCIAGGAAPWLALLDVFFFIIIIITIKRCYKSINNVHNKWCWVRRKRGSYYAPSLVPNRSIYYVCDVFLDE